MARWNVMDKTVKEQKTDVGQVDTGHLLLWSQGQNSHDGGFWKHCDGDSNRDVDVDDENFDLAQASITAVEWWYSHSNPFSHVTLPFFFFLFLPHLFFGFNRCV